ncbi:hypothetical protein PoHVEF18_005709 [Penicillium ochrochloron]
MKNHQCNGGKDSWGLEGTTTAVLDADQLKRPLWECRICFSSFGSITTAQLHPGRQHPTRDKSIPSLGHLVEHMDGFKVVCPEPACGFSFQKLASLAAHCYRWHGWRPGTALENVEYRYLPGVPNDPLLGHSSDNQASLDNQDPLIIGEDDRESEVAETPEAFLSPPPLIPVPELESGMSSRESSPETQSPTDIPHSNLSEPGIAHIPNAAPTPQRPTRSWPYAPGNRRRFDKRELHLQPGIVYPTAADLYDIHAY